MEVRMNALASEYTTCPFQVMNVVSFQKPPHEPPIIYPSTLSAFIVPVRGTARIVIEKQAYILEPGKVLHGAPDKQISFEVLGDEAFEHINIFYQAPEWAERKTDYMHSVFEMHVGDQPPLMDALDELVKLSLLPDVHSRFRLKALTYAALLELFSCSRHTQNRSGQEVVEQAVEYMHQNHTKPISLAQLAQRYDMKKEQFSYLFYKYIGIRPIDYIVQYRMQKAMQQLQLGRRTVKEVAVGVGYSDVFYFSRLFKKHMGKAPSQIKQSI